MKDGSFVSNVFIRPKPNNKFRLIIDLSPLNEYVLKEHFKMDNLNSAIDLLSSGAFLASIDLRDAYYTLPIAEQFKPYMCFQWDSGVYMFHVMPFGLMPFGPKILHENHETSNGEFKEEGDKSLQLY